MLDKVGDNPLSLDDKPATKTDLSNAQAEANAVPAAPRKSAWHYLGKFFFSILQAVLMVAILFGAITMANKMIEEKPEPRKRRAFKTVYTVDTIEAKQGDYQPVFTAYGQTIAARSVDLRSLVSGEIVSVNPNLRAGARVAKGDSLVEIDRFDYLGALAEAEANLNEAIARVEENRAQVALEESKLAAGKEQLEFAQKDYQRMEKLVKRKTSTQQQLEARKLTVSQRQQAVTLSQDTINVQKSRMGQLNATIERLKWRVEQAKRNLQSTTLVAPFDGVVRSSTAELGRAITANDVVVSMFEASALEVRFTLSDTQYGRLQTSKEGLIGRKVEIVWSVGDKEWIYPASIDRIGAEITSNRGGVEIYALVGETTNAVTIRPGAFVEVRVPDKVFKDAIIIPDTAVYGTGTVYTAVDGKLVENTVAIAAYEGETALVTDGLSAGDQVLTTRITEASAGLAVRREGDPVSQRGKPTEGKPNQTQARTGRPSPEEIAKIAKANNLTLDQFRELEQAERRKLIQAHRAGSK